MPTPHCSPASAQPPWEVHLWLRLLSDGSQVSVFNSCAVFAKGGLKQVAPSFCIPQHCSCHTLFLPCTCPERTAVRLCDT